MKKVGIHEVLANKEARVERQQDFLKLYSCPLICVSVNMPGPYKLTPTSVKIFDEVYETLLGELSNFSILKIFTCKELTGKEAMLVVDTKASELKSLTCKLESTHSLGRFVDIDVIDTDGFAISRKDLGMGARKCYLCENDAKLCGRSRAHKVEELVEFIENSVEAFINES